MHDPILEKSKGKFDIVDYLANAGYKGSLIESVTITVRDVKVTIEQNYANNQPFPANIIIGEGEDKTKYNIHISHPAKGLRSKIDEYVTSYKEEFIRKLLKTSIENTLSLKDKYVVETSIVKEKLYMIITSTSQISLKIYIADDRAMFIGKDIVVHIPNYKDIQNLLVAVISMMEYLEVDQSSFKSK